MKRVPNWYVITGGPNSGKTTTIEYLSKLGYDTIPEYARLLIGRELKKGKILEEIRKDEVKFQDKVLKGKLLLEEKASKSKTVFLDRGIPDTIAYSHSLKVDVPKKLIQMSKNRYRKVFLLDVLPYKKDYARDESKKNALEIHKLIKQTYDKLGYKIVRIPVAPIKKRVKLILENLK